MLYRSLADLVLVLHLAFVLFVVLGGLLALRWRRAPWVHLPAAAWGFVLEVWGLGCPLTPLENRLRALGGRPGYAEGFVEHYLLPVLYPSGLDRTGQLALGAGVVVANALVYGLVGWRRRRGRGRPGGGEKGGEKGIAARARRGGEARGRRKRRPPA